MSSAPIVLDNIVPFPEESAPARSNHDYLTRALNRLGNTLRSLQNLRRDAMSPRDLRLIDCTLKTADFLKILVDEDLCRDESSRRILSKEAGNEIFNIHSVVVEEWDGDVTTISLLDVAKIYRAQRTLVEMLLKPIPWWKIW